MNTLPIEGLKICPDCHNVIEGIFCRICWGQRSRKHTLEFQRQFLRSVAEGTRDLKLARTRHTLHIELFGYPDAYCGESLMGHPKRSHSPYHKAIAQSLCPLCRKELEQLLQATPEARS